MNRPRLEPVSNSKIEIKLLAYDFLDYFMKN